MSEPLKDSSATVAEVDPADATIPHEEESPSRGFPDRYEWMDGRSVFWRPESRASTVAQRDIIQNDVERDELSRVYRRTAVRRSEMTTEQIANELDQIRDIGRAYRETGKLPPDGSVTVEADS